MESVLAFLQNEQNAVMAAFVAGIIFKFFPAFKNLSNEWIPLLSAAVAFLTHALSPTPAGASPITDALRGAGGFAFPIFQSIVDGYLAKWFHDIFAKEPLKQIIPKPQPTK